MISTKRIGCFACAVMLVAFGSFAAASVQQPVQIPRIGYVTGRGGGFESFQNGLRDLGYVEEKNIVVEYRIAEGKLDRIPDLVAELVRSKVDVIVSTNLAALRAAKQATKTIPIVMVTQLDPVAAGLVDSLARSGGNITGVTSMTRDLSGKRLELLKEIVQPLSRVGVLWDRNAPGPIIGFKEYETAARNLKIQLRSIHVEGPKPDLEGAFQVAVKGQLSALIAVRNPVLGLYRSHIGELAVKYRLPYMCESIDFVEAAGLMSYAADDADLYRRAAVFVNKILNGAKPADLPIEQPTKFDLVINLKTAKQIGLTIPPNGLARADKVIR